MIFDADALVSGGAMTGARRLITHNTSRANRMHLRSDWQFALLPLEKSDDGAERGGVAIVDVADPAHPRLVLNQSIPNVASRAYTLASPARTSGLCLWRAGAADVCVSAGEVSGGLAKAQGHVVPSHVHV